MKYEGPSFTIKELKVEDRPREKLNLVGKDLLGVDELLAILIHSGIPNKSALQMANELLNSIGGNLSTLGRFSLHDFMKFKGMGKAKATMLVAAMELGRRRMSYEASQAVQVIQSSKDAYRLFHPHLFDLNHEEFWVMHLNRASSLLKMQRLSMGGVAGTSVDLKLLFKSALDTISSSLIIAHNHPSGQLKPSKADRELTQRIVEAGKMLDIQILDHLIITAQGYFSFADEGCL
ncbi:RadC family protein [Aquirufa nivalisilvae]|jgi:DNA repair protein RadC|uniref:RadC family protein n=1 Tax=Aquirufa nivalisilvae TaxID=2516557 RepID=UPI0010330101|nr:DNA repair protein RadC [Aquirufa nivalisilvae]MCZ2481092.1 DNA repair protein RadC [Aquirufa nivalisilvae]TBH73627.1 DNA repair protein RadC [Aquirufa nivalisilvae]